MKLHQFYESLLKQLQETSIQQWNILLSNEEHSTFQYDEQTNHLYFLKRRKGDSFVTDVLELEQWELDAYEKMKQYQFHEITFVFKGFSPDICLSWIFLLARIKGVSVEELPKNWVSYIRQWNRGDVRSTGKPFTSWATLLNSIGHEFYSTNGIALEANIVKQIFHDMMTLTLETLIAKIEPSNVVDLENSPLYNRAKSIIQVELQEYKMLLAQAEKVQLELPFANSNRTVFVDALLGELPNTLGTIKNFARTDFEETYFKQGFSLLCLYNPLANGTGQDISISLDTTVDSELCRLHSELELAETRKWQGTRPEDSPRAGFVYNEPWFILPNKTMIGAPRRLKNGQEGRKLSWSEIKEVVWSVYNPIQNIRIHPYENGKFDTKIEQLLYDVLTENIHGKKLCSVKWSQQYRGTILTPTFFRFMAAKLAQETEVKISINHLADEKSFEVVELDGGKAIVNASGVFYIDDWTNKYFPIETYREDFEKLAKRAERFNFYLKEVRHYTDLFRQLFEQPKRNQKQYKEVITQIVRLKMSIRETVVETMFETQDIYRKQLKNKIENFWGFEAQLEELYSSIKEIEEFINNDSDRKSEKLLRSITIYGLPLTIMTTIYQPTLVNLVLGEIQGIQLITYGVVTFGVIAILRSSINR